MNVKHFSIIVIIIALAACSGKNDSGDHAHASAESKPEAQQDTIKKSIPKEEHAQVGDAHVMIKYHAPSVRGRTIWGGLVPYGEVWVTGAHNATSFEISEDFIVDNRELPAGKYALFTIPDKNSWTFIINKNWDQHLADEYDQKEDVLRISISPQEVDKVQERLRYAIVSKGNQEGAVHISWEKVRLVVPFKVKAGV